MESLKKLLAALSLKQKISIGAAALLIGAALFSFVHWRRESGFRPLYTGLAAEDAAAVVQKLKESGVEYRLSESGSAVLVPAERAPELRLEMAAAGLARSGRIGFELFDKPNFGATDFTEQVNFRRALEGELERSVVSLAEVDQARVHLTFPKDSVFIESRQPAKASVMVKLKPGARMSPQNVLAISHLLASAVEGLTPEGVSVVDMRGNLLSRPKPPAGSDGEDLPEAALDYRRKLERDILSKIDLTLEPLLGADRFRAGVSVDCDFSSGEESEESFDPARSVMVNSQKVEDVGSGGGATGQPGTASNLPRPTSRPGLTNANFSRRTENITYQSSRTVKRVKIPQGAIRRLSVSVLVDQTVRWEGQGEQLKRVITPPPAETLKTIRDLVAGVTGFSAERGDQLIVETLPFESTLNQDPPPEAQPQNVSVPVGLPAWLAPLLNDPKMLLVTGGATAVLLFSAVVFFAILRKRKRKMSAATVKVTPALPGVEKLGELAPAERMQAQIAQQQQEQSRLEAEALNSLKLPQATTKKSEVLTKHLRETVKNDPSSSAQVLRTWLEERTR